MNYTLLGFSVATTPYLDGSGWQWQVKRYAKVVASGTAKNEKEARQKVAAALGKVTLTAAQEASALAPFRAKLRYWMGKRAAVVAAALRQVEMLPREEMIRDAEELEKDEWRALPKAFKKLFPEPGLLTHGLTKDPGEVMTQVLDCFEKLGFVTREGKNQKYELTGRLTAFVGKNYGGWNAFKEGANQPDHAEG